MRDRIERTIEDGKRNQETLQLLHNWCGHVKVRRHGGVGIIEQETGLPIGHAFLECSFASAGGMAAWLLSDTAIDFHDRNCVGCKHRKQMGIPTIAKLVAERDSRVEQQRLEHERWKKEKAVRLAACDARRAEIRKGLKALAASTLDLVGNLDHQQEGAGARLVETAKLAPETFAPEVVQHMLDLINSHEHWTLDPCLEAMSRISTDRELLCNTALMVLRLPGNTKIAAPLVEKHAGYADEKFIAKALQSLITIAKPPFMRMIGSERSAPEPRPLVALYNSHKKAVKSALRDLLAERDPYMARRAALAMQVLSQEDPPLKSFLVPELISKMARARHLLDGRDEEIDDALNDIRDALAQSFLFDPTLVDQKVQEYLKGSSEEGAAELYKIYAEVLRDLRFDDIEHKSELTEAHSVAFRRLVVAASETHSYEVQQVTEGVFHGDPYALTDLAAKHIDLLLGTAAVLDNRRLALRDAPIDGKDPSGAMQRVSSLQHLEFLGRSFIRWACRSAAKTGMQNIKIVLEFLRALPESSDRLAGSIIEHFDALMRSAEGLITCLPDFYAAQVGASALKRSYSATAFGELKPQVRQNLPALAFEAFCTQLSDPVVMVHQVAVHALQRFNLPIDFEARAKQALLAVIGAYSQQSPRETFLVEAIDLYARRYATKEEMADHLGQFFISVLRRADPFFVANELKYPHNPFVYAPGYDDLLMITIADDRAFELYGEDLMERLGELPVSTIQTQLAGLSSLGLKMIGTSHDAVTKLIEIFSAAKLWGEALKLAKAAYEGIEDNVRNRQIKYRADLNMIACDFELAVAARDNERIDQLGINFHKTMDAIKEDNEANKDRRNPLRGFSRPR